MFNIRDVIEIAMQLEKNGEEIYRQASQRVSNPEIASLLNELADDEARHKTWFAEVRDRVEPISGLSAELEHMGKVLLKDALEGQTFSLQDADLSAVEKLGDLLAMAVEFEEDTVLFYQMIGSFITDEKTLEGLERIIKEEKEHVNRLLERGGKRSES